jgi:Protein of unknown function (DUF3606)
MESNDIPEDQERPRHRDQSQIQADEACQIAIRPRPSGSSCHSARPGGQKYEVAYEAKKTGRSATVVKKALKKVGNSRIKVDKRLGSAGGSPPRLFWHW